MNGPLLAKAGMGFIYRIRNRLTQKCYIGETCVADPEKRWKNHLNAIKRNSGCPALRDAIQKYGVDAFEFKVLIICFDEDRFHYEKEYIQRYNTQVPNGYNILPGGTCGGGFKGKKHSDETKSRLRVTSSEAWNRLSDEEKMQKNTNLSARLKQLNISARMAQSDKWKEAVEKMKGRRKDTMQSIEIREKISQSLKKYYENNPDRSPRFDIEKHRDAMCKAVGRPVGQYTPENVLIKEYKSVSEAGRLSGVKKSNISHALKGTNAKAGGFTWKYLDT